MNRFFLSLLLFCIISNLSAWRAAPYHEEYVAEQKAKVMKDANGAVKKPVKFENINILWVIREETMGMYPKNDEGGGYGHLMRGFINLKKLKPRAGNKIEFTVDDIDEKPNGEPTPVHISVKRQEGNLPYLLIVEYPTYVIYYNAYHRDMFGSRID